MKDDISLKIVVDDRLFYTGSSFIFQVCDPKGQELF